MPTYTVHAPPQREGRAVDPQRFAFVRDGFHVWAFLLTPIWLLYRRLWLVFVGYLLLIAAMEAMFYVVRAPEFSRLVVEVLIGLLVGLEAGSLRRWTYGRRKWTTVGIVNEKNEESAERRFFAQWVERAPAVEPVTVAAATPPRAASNDIIGLFPEAGGRP